MQYSAVCQSKYAPLPAIFISQQVSLIYFFKPKPHCSNASTWFDLHCINLVIILHRFSHLLLITHLNCLDCVSWTVKNINVLALTYFLPHCTHVWLGKSISSDIHAHWMLLFKACYNIYIYTHSFKEAPTYFQDMIHQIFRILLFLSYCRKVMQTYLEEKCIRLLEAMRINVLTLIDLAITVLDCWWWAKFSVLEVVESWNMNTQAINQQHTVHVWDCLLIIYCTIQWCLKFVFRVFYMPT